MANNFRSVCFNPEAIESLLSIFDDDYQNMDDKILGLEWILANSPEIGLKVTNNVWIFGSSEFCVKPFKMFYIFSDKNVEIMYVRAL